MNRYVIEGLLQDLVYRKKQIILASASQEMGAEVHDLLLDELHSYRWSYNLERAGKDFIEFRRGGYPLGGGRIDFKSLHLPLGLEGKRADIWVAYGARQLPLAYADPAMRVIQGNAALTPDSEIILID